MDWYAWLCGAGLHPDVALDYALVFARNELGAADVRHLDHDSLASMGVAVAKHRLQILKLARRESSAVAAITVLPWRATRLLAAAARRSARSVLARLRASRGGGRGWSRDAGPTRARPPALAALPPCRGGARVAHGWSRAASSPLPTRAAKLPLPMLASGPALADRWRGGGAAKVRALPAPAGAIAGCLAGAEACSFEEGASYYVEEEEMMDGGGVEEEMRWESMFQDLKPT